MTGGQGAGGQRGKNGTPAMTRRIGSLRFSRVRLPLLLVLAACSRPAAPPPERARLEADWTGSDTGKLSGRATAEWCDSLRVLEIRAVRGDSGVAVALYPADSVVADSYPVLPPARADSTPPAAAVGLRWFAETTVEGFRGDSGAVVVEAAASGRLSGRFLAHLRSVTGVGRLTLRGTFRDLPVVPAARGCVSDRSAEPTDSGID